VIEVAAIASGGVALAAIIVIAVLAFKLAAAWGVVADARVDAANKAGQLAIAAADVASWRNRSDAEKRRADALDDLLSDVALDADPVGARDRVLARWERLRASHDPDPASDPDSGPVLTPSSP
jgi:hypothetical protein